MADDVFVTAADDIGGFNSKQIAARLAIPENPTGFRVTEFTTQTEPGFIGGARTAGGAR